MRNIRLDFPILDRKFHGKKLVYFDNAATSQKPQQVISAVSDFYQNHNANIHRGVHTLAEEATQQYENARKKVAKFINAKSEKEIIFVRNTTEALNLLAFTLKPKEVTTSVMEHHSNFLPWQRIAKLKVVDIDENYELEKIPQSKFITLTHASNVLGTINEKGILDLPCRQAGAARMTDKILIVDGAQAVAHFPVDVQKLGCDFYAFSGHKMFGPMGIGVLWGKQKLLEKMPPFMVGGGMISYDLPDKFEAGTPDVAGAIGLAAAVDYINSIGFEKILKFEFKISDYLIEQLKKFPEITIYGPKTAKNRVPAISFSIQGIHPHDAAQFLNDRYGIAVRAGQHCTAPLHKRLGIPATIRASLAFYNTEEEIDILTDGIKELIKKFHGHL